MKIWDRRLVLLTRTGPIALCELTRVQCPRRRLRFSPSSIDYGSLVLVFLFPSVQRMIAGDLFHFRLQVGRAQMQSMPALKSRTPVICFTERSSLLVSSSNQVEVNMAKPSLNLVPQQPCKSPDRRCEHLTIWAEITPMPPAEGGWDLELR